MNTEEPITSVAYTECYVAFLDILGFKDLVKKSIAAPTLRNALVHALEMVASLSPTDHSKRKVEFHADASVTASPFKNWKTQIRAFSDSVAIFIPVESNGLTDVLWKIRYLHDRLFELNYCVRGAITIGQMYWDDSWWPSTSADASGVANEVSPKSQKLLYEWGRPANQFITLGPALIDAYLLESDVAVYPRIVFSPTLMEHIREMASTTPESSAQDIHKAVHAVFLCSPSPENAKRYITDFIREDADGVPFLDVFHKDIDRDDVLRIERKVLDDGRVEMHWVRDGMTHERFMGQARDSIRHFLDGHHPDKVRAKYLWLANYFDSAASELDIAPLMVKWEHRIHQGGG